MSKLWNWIKSLFAGERIGVVWRKLFEAGRNAVRDVVNDPECQEKALAVARELALSSLSNADRRESFDAELKAWGRSAGKRLAESAINLLREAAVVALKGE